MTTPLRNMVGTEGKQDSIRSLTVKVLIKAFNANDVYIQGLTLTDPFTAGIRTGCE